MEEFIDHSPVGERTAKSESVKILSGLADIHNEAFGGKEEDFYRICVTPMWNEDVIADDLIGRVHTDTELVGWVENPVFAGEREARTLVALMRVSCAYAIQSMKAEDASGVAWAYACKASEWLGLALGFFSHCGRHVGNNRLSHKGGVAKNANINKLKDWVINEYRQGTWKSKRNASFKLAESAIKKAPEFNATISNVDNQAQKTVYKWILALSGAQ